MGNLDAPLKDWLSDLGGLLFPRRCSSCDSGLFRHENILCTQCRSDLPLARFHDDPKNRVEQLFFGRLRLHAASAFLLFNRSGVVQRMLHRLKYMNDPDLGIELGRMMARDLAGSERFREVDLLMAVPLHKRKELQRGYNQSQLLVDGMKEHLKVPAPSNCLVRIVDTKSQTRKGRISRSENVKEAFVLRSPETFKGRHILLVDDVITTGATLESCASAVLAAPGVRVSIFTAACA